MRRAAVVVVVETVVEAVAVPSIGSSSPCSPGSLLVSAGTCKHISHQHPPSDGRQGWVLGEPKRPSLDAAVSEPGWKVVRALADHLTAGEPGVATLRWMRRPQSPPSTSSRGRTPAS